MAGTGNLLLKRGTLIPYDVAQDDAVTPPDANTPVLIKGMPAAQIVGLSNFYETGTGMVGFAQNNYPNRLWMGMDGWASASSVDPEATAIENTVAVEKYPFSGTPVGTNGVGVRRPLWMGAEIRAYQPLKEDSGTAGTYGSAGKFVILKADWDRPSDYVLVTQKAIAMMPLRSYEHNLAPDVLTPPDSGTNKREYIEFTGWTPPSGTAGTIGTSTKYCFPDGGASAPSQGIYYILGCSSTVAEENQPQTFKLAFFTTNSIIGAFVGTNTGSNVAILGSDGATKGKQTFLSPIGIENYLELLPYSDGVSNLPATIKSTTVGAASIFDENITDLSIGGAAELIEIGNGSTGGNTATTIYGELTVTGPTNLSSDTVIDGGTF